jgi:hypothetical protein
MRMVATVDAATAASTTGDAVKTVR